MKIQQLVLCGVGMLLLGSGIAASDLTGFWGGLAPDGLIFPSGSGKCNADLLLDLADNGGVLSGSARVLAQIVTDNCQTQNLSSRELATGQILPSPVIGQVGAGTVSFTILIEQYMNGVPLRFSAVAASGTFTTDRLTTTGTLLPTRAWNDQNHNHVPDCNWSLPTANGECGVWQTPTATPTTLVATAGPDLIEGETVTGDLTVSAGQNVICLDGGISGNVTVRGGGLLLSHCAVGGNLQISGGTFSLGPSTSVDGNMVVQNIPAGSTANQVCETTVANDLQFHDNGAAVQIGSAGPACRGNTIGNNLNVYKNTAVTAIYNNVVGNDLKVNNNTAGPQVFSNSIGNNLQCAGNAAQPLNSITGGGNTAKAKQGQCAAF